MPDTRYDEALNQILELTVLLNEDMTTALAKIGLTGARVQVVWTLNHAGPSTQKALADALGVSARNITGLVDALAETGFVTREPHPRDRRASLVTLTKHGAAIATDLERQQHELAHQLFGDMSARRYDGLTKGLADVLDRLRTLIAQSKE
ncbi:MarR family transcriptional regulator [Nocardioidaceae bacterium SCSIO 66511]|nr:MarR family transcriptional regulator [Nocardioidaceae bacterium SCSIO 66511]